MIRWRLFLTPFATRHMQYRDRLGEVRIYREIYLFGIRVASIFMVGSAA